MCLCRFLTKLHQLVGFLNGQRVQIHAINCFIKMQGCGTQIATCPMTLAQRIIAGQCIIRVIQQHLELPNRLIPALLLLVEPAQEVPSVRSIKTAFENLLTEVNSIRETSLGLKRLCLLEYPCDLASGNPPARSRAHSPTSPSHSRGWTRMTNSTEVARATHVTHDASITSA